MRRAYNGSVLNDAGGHLIGFNLGADYCAEHEWGIDGIRANFGLATFKADDRSGIVKRTITKLPATLQYHAATHALAMWWDPEEFARNGAKALRGQDGFTPRAKEDFIGAWDQKSFGIVAHTDMAKRRLPDLWEAFQHLDVAIFLGGGKIFENSGLAIVIVSRVAQEHLDVMRIVDEDASKLQRASEATGIATRLKTTGREYFALSPHWAAGFKDHRTKHSVVYWLNPMQQHNNNFGWFTVEDLDAWIAGTGPIPKGRP